MQITCTDKELFIFNKIATAAEGDESLLLHHRWFVRDKIIGRQPLMQISFARVMEYTLPMPLQDIFILHHRFHF
jgi:hypothetical protein